MSGEHRCYNEAEGKCPLSDDCQIQKDIFEAYHKHNMVIGGVFQVLICKKRDAHNTEQIIARGDGCHNCKFNNVQEGAICDLTGCDVTTDKSKKWGCHAWEVVSPISDAPHFPPKAADGDSKPSECEVATAQASGDGAYDNRGEARGGRTE